MLHCLPELGQGGALRDESGGASGLKRHSIPSLGRPTYFFFVLFLGILAPDLRASFKAIATACLRLFTLRPLPDFRVPCLCSRITLATVRLPLPAELFVRI